MIDRRIDQHEAGAEQPATAAERPAAQVSERQGRAGTVGHAEVQRRQVGRHHEPGRQFVAQPHVERPVGAAADVLDDDGEGDDVTRVQR